MARFVQLLKRWLRSVQLGIVMKMAGVAVFVQLIDLLSILLGCNVFARTQKAVVDQTGSRPPNGDHDVFLVQIWLWEMLWSFFSVQPLSRSSLVVI